MTAHLTPAETLFFEGNRHMRAGDNDEAERCFRQALTLVPDFSEALANLAMLREQAGAMQEAESCYRRAIALYSGNVQVQLNLGVLLLNMKRFDEAETVNRLAVQQAPESAAAWSNLGVLLACTKRETEAEQCYRQAMALDAGYAKARFNLSYLLLRQGRFEEGWPCLEARVWNDYMAGYFSCARWQGEPLTGKTIAIGFEAGHGDMIQFCRYAVALKAMGAAHVTLICHPGLQTLFATLPGVDEIRTINDDISATNWDYWTLPMSLPYHCGTRADTIPAPIPYLAADAATAAAWASRLPAAALRVGLAWRGNARFENDADRSLPGLSAFAPLGAVTGVQFVSLQKGPGEEEALHPPAGLPLLALGPTLQDFADTAALISQLDLVISVDTAVAHLAGSLGKPCWVLLPDYRTDWRWLTERSDSPWYPQHMRLFRQTHSGDWPPVIAAVAAALALWKTAQESTRAAS
jgi:Flp pilus assembly protein TadD